MRRGAIKRVRGRLRSFQCRQGVRAAAGFDLAQVTP